MLHFSSPLLPLLLLPSLSSTSPASPSLLFPLLSSPCSSSPSCSLFLSSSLSSSFFFFFPPPPLNTFLAERQGSGSGPSPVLQCAVWSWAYCITSLAWSDLTGNIKSLNWFVQGGSVFISVLWLFSISDTEEGLGNVWQSISLPIHEVIGHKEKRIHIYTHLHKWTWITKHHSSQEEIWCQGLRCRFWN